MNDIFVLTTTVAAEEDARTIADALITGRLAACVQSWPVTSVYTWEGNLAHAAEIRVEAKTVANRVDAATDRVRKLHQYEEPEIVVTPVTSGSESYLNWIRESVT